MGLRDIRYGIIGCGSMGREHIENIEALPDDAGRAIVTALADPHAPSLDAARALCRGRPQAFADHRALAASGLCDAVVVATPNFTHAAILRDLFETRLAVLVEKPVATTIADGVDLVARERARRADAANGIVWVAQEYRYMPPVAEALRMAKEGAVGRVQQVAIREHREPFYPKVGDWNRFSANTGGTLVEKCCHYFNLMDLVVGESPLAVFASGGQRVNHLDERYAGRVPDILDSAFAIVEYPGGVRAMLDLCMFAEASVDREQLSIVGDAGKLESLLPSLTLRYGRRTDWGRRTYWGEPSGTGRGIEERRVWDERIRFPGQHFGASYLEHLAFATALRDGAPAAIPVEEGVRAVATGIAAHRSIDERRRVELAEVLPPTL